MKLEATLVADVNLYYQPFPEVMERNRMVILLKLLRILEAFTEKS